MKNDIEVFDAWRRVLDEESLKLDEERYDRFLKCFLDVLSVPELFRIIGKETIIKWINQFEIEDQDTAFSILRKIKYYSSTDMIQLCQLNFSNWIIDCDANVKNTVFIPLGGAGKSGSMVGYLFRMANSLSKVSFYSLYEIEKCGYVFDKRIKDLVFLDDYSGTGDQFLKDEILKNILLHTEGKLRVSFLPVVMSRRAKNRIESNTNINIYCNQVREDREYSDSESALIRRYGKGLFVNKGEDLRFGWGNMGETIAFFYNVPNNTLPIIWSKGHSDETKRNWIPLIPRVNPKGDNEIQEVIRNTIQISNMVSEDYPVYIQALTEAYVMLKDKKAVFSFKDIFDMQYCLAQIMYPYNLVVRYHSPFLYLQKLRINLLRTIKETVDFSAVSKNDLINFFKIDYPVIDQGFLLQNMYAYILAEYVLSNGLDLSEFVNCINREMDSNKELVYEIEGYVSLARKIKKKRGVTEKENALYEHLLEYGKNMTLKYWIAKCFITEKSIDVIDEKDVYIIVNNYGKYEVWTLQSARDYQLI